MRLLRKRVVKYDVSFYIHVLQARILSSGNEYFSKTLEAHISRINFFLLIFSPICSKSASTLKKLFQFKKFESSYGRPFEFPFPLN